MRPNLLATSLTLLALAGAGACEAQPASSEARAETRADPVPSTEVIAVAQTTEAQPTEAQPVEARAEEAQVEETQGTAQEAPAAQPDRRNRSRVIRRYMLEAEGLMPLIETDAVRQFLAEVRELPEIRTRRIYVYQSATPSAIPALEFEMAPEHIKAALKPQNIDITKYYQTVYGSPLAYARPLDLLAGVAEWDSFNSKKILDFGYGQIGQLRLLAQTGADVTGIESSTMISSIYTLPDDTGEIAGASGNTGSIALHQGYWPAGQFAREKVGTGYDLIMARNVLRKGPMDLDVQVRPELRVRLRSSNEMFLARTNEALNMGGYALVYNIGGAGPELWEQFPASDFSCPFTTEQWEAAGFELIANNMDDDEPMREVAKALFLDRGPNGINLETQMYATYTIARKVREATIPGTEPEASDELP